MTRMKALKIVKADGFDIENMTTEQEEAVIYLNLIESKLVEYKKHLLDTDWYYARKMETGEEIPEDVAIKRTEAREFIRSQEDA